MRGVAYALGAKEEPPVDALVLPSYEEVKADRHAFARRRRSSTRRPTRSTPDGSSSITTGRRSSATRPTLPISQEDMDRIYGLPYTRQPHPMYKGEKIPAFETVKDSVTIMRGCFGGCTFCSITAHQGRIIQSRSQESVLDEIRRMGQDPSFSGVVSDIGGPTANMYQMRCTRPEVEARCKRLSCVHPKVCKLLGTDHGPLVRIDARESRGSGRRSGAGRFGRADGSGAAVSRIHGGAGRAPRRRSPEGRPRAHRPRGPQADEEARASRLRGVRRGLPGGQRPGGEAKAIPRPLLHRVAPRQRPATR